MTDQTLESSEIPQTITTRGLVEDDVPQIVPILQQWVRDSQTGEILQDEIDDIIAAMHQGLGDDPERAYIAAQTTEGNIAGVIGLQEPQPRMQHYAQNGDSLEVINAFVDGEVRGQGIGKQLIAGLEELARDCGASTLILNSGPRYKNTAWGFYDSLPGYKRVGMSLNHYGEGLHAPVWRRELSETFSEETT